MADKGEACGIFSGLIVFCVGLGLLLKGGVYHDDKSYDKTGSIVGGAIIMAVGLCCLGNVIAESCKPRQRQQNPNRFHRLPDDVEAQAVVESTGTGITQLNPQSS